MKKIKKIGVLSFAKMYAFISFFVGLFTGILVFALGGLLPLSGAPTGSGGLLAGLGIVAIISYPIMYAIFGFIAGAIGAFLYNLASGFFGGIEIELEN